MAMAVPLDLDYTTRARVRERGKGRSDCSFVATKNDTTINKVRAEGCQKWRKNDVTNSHN